MLKQAWWRRLSLGVSEFPNMHNHKLPSYPEQTKTGRVFFGLTLALAEQHIKPTGEPQHFGNQIELMIGRPVLRSNILLYISTLYFVCACDFMLKETRKCYYSGTSRITRVLIQ